MPAAWLAAILGAAIAAGVLFGRRHEVAPKPRMRAIPPAPPVPAGSPPVPPVITWTPPPAASATLADAQRELAAATVAVARAIAAATLAQARRIPAEIALAQVTLAQASADRDRASAIVSTLTPADPSSQTDGMATSTPPAPTSFPNTYGNARPRPINEASQTIQRWWPSFYAAATANGIPPLFMMGWMAEESGGYPGSVGQPGAKGPDGYPREVGLLQLYNPDDFQALGVTPAQLLAADPVTAAGIYTRFVLLKKRQADHNLINARIAWPTTTPDYWSAVKLEHGSTAYPPKMYEAVVQRLGRAPSSWREFRQTFAAIHPEAVYKPALGADAQNYYFRILDNAEWAGFHVSPQPPAVS